MKTGDLLVYSYEDPNDTCIMTLFLDKEEGYSLYFLPHRLVTKKHKLIEITAFEDCDIIS